MVLLLYTLMIWRIVRMNRETFNYMTLDAKNGNVYAQQNLAKIYETGLDPDGESIPEVSVDYPKALKWFHRAAEQGFELAVEDGKNLYEKMRQWRFHPSVSVWGPQDELNSK